MKVAIAGATGLVGQTMLKILEEREFPVTKLIPIASEASKGKTVEFKGEAYEVTNLEAGILEKPDLALFSMGSDLSKEWAPKFKEQGCVVVDNSSAWRMEDGVPLIVPEVNPHVLKQKDKIIANPNCSTIQLVMVLHPLHQRFHLARVIVSTYQAVTGTGTDAKQQMLDERAGTETKNVYPHPIDLNVIPHCDDFLNNGYTKEEQKIINESRKILENKHLRISSTAVRVPVFTGHSESVNIEFENEFQLDEIKMILEGTFGIVVQDDVKGNSYPMPKFAEGDDEVFVGRIRMDESQPNTIHLWIVSDNLRKGAATNAIQIAEYLVQQGWL